MVPRSLSLLAPAVVLLLFLGAGAGPTAATVSSRIVIGSESVAITLALGPLAEPAAPPLRIPLGTPLGLVGQVVDGDHVPLWQGGLVTNTPVVSPFAEVFWSIDGEADRAHRAPLGWNDPARSDDDGVVNGTFSLVATPTAGAPSSFTLRVWFDGIVTMLGGVPTPLYPPATTSLTFRVLAPVDLGMTPPATVAAGEEFRLQGWLRDRSGSPLADGLVVRFDDTVVAADPRPGVSVDSVAIRSPTAPDIIFFSEDFEAETGWQAGGSLSEWERGTPATGPSVAYAGVGVAGTDLDGDYALFTDSWFQSPTVDLATIPDATLTFQTWVDLAPGDRLLVGFSNDDGLTWPVSVPVSVATGAWTKVDIPLPAGVVTTQYGVVDIPGHPQVRVRFHLVSAFRSVAASGGGFEVMVPVPGLTIPGLHRITAEHPETDSYAGAVVGRDVRVVRRCGVSYSGPLQIHPGHWAPLDLRVAPTIPGATPVDGGSLSIVATLSDGTEAGYGTFEVVAGAISGANIFLWPSTPRGSFQILASYSGDETTLPCTGVFGLEIVAGTEIMLDRPDPAVELGAGPVEVAGRLRVLPAESPDPSGSGEPVTGANLAVSWDGVEVAMVVTNQWGRFQRTIDAPPPGVRTLSVTYAGGGSLLASSASIDFTRRAATEITLALPAVEKGGSAVGSGLLRTSGPAGVPIPAARIAVTVGAGLALVTTGPDGRFAFPVSVPVDAATSPVPVAASFAGNSGFLAARASGDAPVSTGSELAVLVDSARLLRGGRLHVTGTLWEDTPGATAPPPGVAGARVVIRRAGDPLVLTDAVTGPTGAFAVTLDIPGDWPLGPGAVEVTWPGDAIHHGSIGTAMLTVATVPTLDVTLRADHFVPGASLRGMAQLRDEVGRPLALPVLLSVDGRPLGTLQLTGATEPDEFSVPLPSDLASGPHRLAVDYAGDEAHEAAVAEVRFRVDPAVPVVEPRTAELTAGFGLAALLLVLVAVLDPAKYLLLKLLVVPMYTKLRKEGVLDHFLRGQIYGLVRTIPGVHYSFIKRRLNLPNGVLAFHLSVLEREGYIMAERQGLKKRFFANDVQFEVPVFLSKVQIRILEFLKIEPGVPQKEIAAKLDLSHSTLNDNVQSLWKQKLIRLEREGKNTRCFLEDRARDVRWSIDTA